MSRIFISYSHENSEIVKKVNTYLSENRIFTWFDVSSIREGDRWETNISTAIFSCDVFMMFYSRAYRESEYCNKEYRIMCDKVQRPDIVVVDLDGSRNSFSEHDVTGYQFVNYKDGDIDDLCRSLLENKSVKKCSLIPKANRRTFEGTHFFNALRNLKTPKHYNVLEPLIRFLVEIKEQEAKGKYISDKADFSSLQAYDLDNDSFELELVGENDFSAQKDIEVRNNYIRNLMRASFGYGRTEFKRTGLPSSLEFESVFTTANHRFSNLKTDFASPRLKGEKIDREIYSLINERLCNLYEDMPPLDELIKRLGNEFEASKYYESLESRFGIVRPLPYEINPSIIEISRKLFMRQNGIGDFGNEACFPEVTTWKSGLSGTAVTVEKLISQRNDDTFLRGNYGSGKSFLMKRWFVEDRDSFYIDLGNPVWAGSGSTLDYGGSDDIFSLSDVIRSFLERQEPTGYKINFYKLYNYSVYTQKITILLDNIDNMSEVNRQKVLAEVDKLKDVFRFVIVSYRHDVEGKLSLNKNSDNLDHFKRYEIQPLKKRQIISFLQEKIEEGEQTGFDVGAIISEFEKLDENDELFTFFDNFTKLDILYGSVSDWRDFSVSQLKREFNAKIKVYQNIFESNQTYSLPKKIASLFQESVVDIEDVIMELVRSEITELKRISYNSDSLIVNIDLSENQLRFRDHYPILTKITGRYLFVNEDVHSYFVASYIHSQVTGGNMKEDFAALQELLKKVKNNYAVLEYLREFDILRDIDTELLLNNPTDYEELVYILYKIVQYYGGDDAGTQREFLKNARFEIISDKFFFGAENIERVVVPPSVTEIGRAAFSNMPRLKEIDFAPRGVKIDIDKRLRIRPWAILNCPSLQKIRIGNRNYRTYESPLFSRCYALSRIEIGENNGVFTTANDGQILVSKDKKILYCAVNSLTGELAVPDGVEIIEDNALSYLKKVTEISIPASVSSIATNFSDFCDRLERFSVDKNNKSYYTDESGNMYTSQGERKTLFRVPSGLKGSLSIQPGVNVIGSDSISCCIYLEEITVPSSVDTVENYAFADTYSLKKLTFKDIDRIEDFGTYTFLSTNDNLKVFGDKQYDLDEFNSEYCSSLTEVRQSGKLRRAVTADIFARHGFEIIREGIINSEYNSEIVVVRDITLFKLGTYREQDFNIFLIGLTEYNSILMKNALEAADYLKKLITENYIDMVVLSRNLPMISHLENVDLYGGLLIARSDSSSSATARQLSEIIHELGEKQCTN